MYKGSARLVLAPVLLKKLINQKAILQILIWWPKYLTFNSNSSLFQLLDCPACSAPYESTNDVIDHIVSYHATKWTCTICGSRSYSAKAFSCHLRWHVEGTAEPEKEPEQVTGPKKAKYHCQVCDRIFMSAFQLYDHQGTAHLVWSLQLSLNIPSFNKHNLNTKGLLDCWTLYYKLNYKIYLIKLHLLLRWSHIVLLLLDGITIWPIALVLPCCIRVLLLHRGSAYLRNGELLDQLP